MKIGNYKLKIVFMSILNLFKKLFSLGPHIRFGLGVQDVADIKRKWMEVEQLIALGKPSNFKTAILEADKILDYVLKLYGYSGQTMGDRMKAIPRDKHSRDFFDNMWQAHKLRNEMVHNMGYEVQDFEAKSAIQKFEKVLRELGVL